MRPDQIKDPALRQRLSALVAAQPRKVAFPGPAAPAPAVLTLPEALSFNLTPDARPEAAIQGEFAEELKKLGYLFRWARMDQRSALTPGWPDFDVILPEGRVCYIEFKNTKGTTSPAQDEIHARMLASGHRVFLCRSVGQGLATVHALRSGRMPDLFP